VIASACALAFPPSCLLPGCGHPMAGNATHENYDAEEECDAKEDTRKQAVASSLCVANGVFMTAVMMVLPARAPMVLEIMKGDTQAAARTLGFMSSCGAALELFLNPVLGRLSDQYGRKPFLLMAPSIRAFLHAVAAAFPNSLRVQYVDRIVAAAMVYTFQAPINAALTDLFEGKELAVAMARNQTFFGLGCALGPFIGSRLGGAKAFMGSSAMFVLSVLWLIIKFPETLTEKDKHQFDILACSPIRFLKLFQGRILGSLATTTALQSCGDYPNVYDFNFLYLKSVFGYGQTEVGSFATAVGVTQILGGEAMGLVIKATGQKFAVLASNVAYAASMALLGTSRSVPQLAVALFAMTFGHLRATPVNAYLQQHGQRAMMGRAEIVSAQMNLTAIIKIVAPILYGYIFSWATSKGRRMPGMPYFCICLMVAIAQLCFWSINPEIPKLFRRATSPH